MNTLLSKKIRSLSAFKLSQTKQRNAKQKGGEALLFFVAELSERKFVKLHFKRRKNFLAAGVPLRVAGCFLGNFLYAPWRTSVAAAAALGRITEHNAFFENAKLVVQVTAFPEFRDCHRGFPFLISMFLV